MAGPKTLKLTSRSPNKPIKNLPASVELSDTTTVEDVKVMIANAVGIKDHNQIGLFYPSTKKTLKDRKAVVVQEETVIADGGVLVKNLGTQIAWRTVFIIEYFGPLLFHPLVLALRPYIYKGSPEPLALSNTQWLAFAMFMLHFLKREYETIFVHRFSANTMPARNIVKNSFFYWALAGLLSAYSIYSPTSFAAVADKPAIDAVGALIFAFGEVNNLLIHSYLSSLRSPGGTERKIPVGYGFGLVTCPNYMFEVLAWVGIIVATRDWTVALFIGLGIFQMAQWAKGKERAYRNEFGDRYKKKRYTMLPGLF